MTHNTPAPIADKALAERLADMARVSAPLFGNMPPHPKFVPKYRRALEDAYRSGQLITLAEAQAMVAAAYEMCAWIADYAGAKQVSSDGSYSHHVPVMGPDVAAAIRAAQPAPAKGGE